MEQEKIKLRITIAQRVTELYTTQEHEHYYRQAEKMINDAFFNFAKQWPYTDPQDLLSKILLHYMVKHIVATDRLTAYEEDLIPKMEDLKKLTEKLDIN